MTKIKVVCTISDGFYELGKIYEADGITKFFRQPVFTFNGSIPINACFITLAEWREKRINEILNE